MSWHSYQLAIVSRCRVLHDRLAQAIKERLSINDSGVGWGEKRERGDSSEYVRFHRHREEDELQGRKQLSLLMILTLLITSECASPSS